MTKAKRYVALSTKNLARVWEWAETSDAQDSELARAYIRACAAVGLKWADGELELKAYEFRDGLGRLILEVIKAEGVK